MKTASTDVHDCFLYFQQDLHEMYLKYLALSRNVLLFCQKLLSHYSNGIFICSMINLVKVNRKCWEKQIKKNDRLYFWILAEDIKISGRQSS